jgi:hypothetical protein
MRGSARIEVAFIQRTHGTLRFLCEPPERSPPTKPPKLTAEQRGPIDPLCRSGLPGVGRMRHARWPALEPELLA